MRAAFIPFAPLRLMRWHASAASAPSSLRRPSASTANSYPPGFFSTSEYIAQPAKKKLEQLWDRLNAGNRDRADIPEAPFAGLPQKLRFALSLPAKMTHDGDESPPKAYAGTKYTKQIHTVGLVGKARLQIDDGSPYSGFLKEGCEEALVRLSLGDNPSVQEGVVEPGFALKLLIDGEPSVNTSCIFRLDGQGQDTNFFRNVQSHMTIRGSFKKTVEGVIARTVSNFPRIIAIHQFAQYNSKGRVPADEEYFPYVLTFVPTEQGIKDCEGVVSGERTILQNLQDKVRGSPTEPYTLYEVRAVAPTGKVNNVATFDECRAAGRSLEAWNEYIGRAERIGTLQLVSDLVSSEFGDAGLFFKHMDFQKGLPFSDELQSIYLN